MLYPIKDVLKARSRGTKESLLDSVETMKREGTTGFVVVYLPEGEYTIAFEEGNLVTASGPMAATVELLLERAEHGEICVFSVEKKIFSSYLGYLEDKLVQKSNGTLNTMLVDLVNKRHTGAVAVMNTRGEGFIFLVEGVPETAYYGDKGRILSGTEALEGIMKMAEESSPEVRVYAAVKSTESLVGSIPVADMKVRGLFFNALRSRIREKVGDDAASLFSRRVGRSSYYDLVMYPLEEFMRATEIANEVLETTDFELGKTVYTDFRKSMLGRIVFFLESADTPSKLGKVAQLAWTAAVNYGERWVAEDTEGKIVFRAKNDGDRCERVQGVLAGAMEAIGYECTVKETECEKRGGRFCEYVVEWDAAKQKK